MKRTGMESAHIYIGKKIRPLQFIMAQLLLLVSIFIIAGCSVKQSYTQNPKYMDSNKRDVEDVSSSLHHDVKPKMREYRIAEGDVIRISVWREDDLKEDVIVRPDGRLSFPLVGDIQAVGLTFNELKGEITDRLTEYLIDPKVSISLQKSKGIKIIVLGEVKEPGVYTVTGKMTVIEAIAKASGFTEHAVASSVIYVRGGTEKTEGRRLDLSHALNEIDLSQNIVLQTEDIIYVPKKFVANVNYYVRQFVTPIAAGAALVHSFE